MRAEVEAKLLADGPGPLAALAALDRVDGVRLGPPRTVDEVDRYLDTAGGRLSAALWACRLRRREGVVRVSLKGPPEGVAGSAVHRRPELEGPATESLDPATWPDSAARRFLDELRGEEPLVERLLLVQRRTERAVLLDGGTTLGTLSLDEVSIGSGERRAGDLYAVELELASDAGDAATVTLERLAAILAARPGLRADPRSKLEHALAALAALAAP
jgi:inorganic triphosphatase YgiF